MELLLFPNQLFDLSILKRFINKHIINRVHFIEDPLYYGNRDGSDAVSKLSLNQLRIIYMYVVHRKYVQLLKTTYDVVYHEIDTFTNTIYDTIKKSSSKYVYFDPSDHLLTVKLQKHFGIENLVCIDTPSFFASKADLEIYDAMKKGKRLQHSQFYEYMKSKFHILEGVKSMDKMNRTPYSKNIIEPKNPYYHTFSDEKEWVNALLWLNKSTFHMNPKPSMTWDILIKEYLMKLPLTTLQARIWMNDFFKQRFDQYGKYQDVIIDTNPLLYHSGLSIFINNGLLTPHEVVNMATKTYISKGQDNQQDIANYEGFVRQILGWREYCRYYYYHVPSSIYRKNIFKQSKRSLSNIWYDGTTGIPILDKTIIHAMNYGYINHIQRLMIVSNFMTLNNYHPDMLYRWMYEFSLDSYEWVMVFNCYSMGSWSDHGFAMRKPYISSANYILKMSNETKGDGQWVTQWDKSYHSFLQKNKPILKHTYLANLL